MFHFLVDQTARRFVGGGGQFQRHRVLMSRAFQHSQMAKVSKSFSGGTLPKALAHPQGHVPSHFVRIADIFVIAQEQRHLADYDLGVTFTRDDVLHLINHVEAALDGWPQIRDSEVTLYYMISLIAPDRR